MTDVNLARICILRPGLVEPASDGPYRDSKWLAAEDQEVPAGPYADFYPGPRYCDILAADIYGEFKQIYHDDLAALANGKPIALGEIGRVPTPAILKEQPEWAWFMVWADLLRMSKIEAVQELFNDPRTLSRGDPLQDNP